jgi:hypothetical protein
MFSRRPRNGIVIACRRKAVRSSAISLPAKMTRMTLFVGERDADASRTKIPGKADSHHIALRKDLLGGLLTFLFGDAARLDAVNLGLIHFD